MQKLCKKLKQKQSKYFLSNIIHDNKTGFVEGRYIGERVRSIFDVMDQEISSYKECFDEAKSTYQEAISKSGNKYKLPYMETHQETPATT